jgi:hypothetical protein
MRVLSAARIRGRGRRVARRRPSARRPRDRARGPGASRRCGASCTAGGGADAASARLRHVHCPRRRRPGLHHGRRVPTPPSIRSRSCSPRRRTSPCSRWRLDPRWDPLRAQPALPRTDGAKPLTLTLSPRRGEGTPSPRLRGDGWGEGSVTKIRDAPIAAVGWCLWTPQAGCLAMGQAHTLPGLPGWI